MAKRHCLTLVLAAGEGTRMKSAKPKVMHEVAGAPMLAHVLAAVNEAGADRVALVAGPNMPSVRDLAKKTVKNLKLFEQKERLGTAHAVLSARAALEDGADDVIVLFGDTPLVRGKTLQAIRDALAKGADVVVLGFHAPDPTGYGRLLMDRKGALKAIREERDASAAERRVTLCNSGVFGFQGKHLPELLDRIGNDNAKREYYLTDAVEIARKARLKTRVIECPEEEVLGVNSRAEQAHAEAAMQHRLRAAALEAGVTMIAPETVFLSADTRFEEDVSIEPHVVFGPGVTVRKGARIKAHCHIEGADIGPGATIGPFARLRPGATIGKGAKIGNFVEVKNANVGAGAKVNHLAYVGDAEIGTGSNIGAGVITCNYDGMAKHRTVIGQGVFVGSNSALVAPVTIEDGAYVGTGSVVTKDVPADALAIARARQATKPGWAATFREKFSVKKTT